MSVIVMGKDVPQTCAGCFLHDWGMCAVSKGLASNKERPAHCPLKSVEELISKIEAIDRYGSPNGHDIYLRTPEDIKFEVIKIIREYCGVSNHD